MSFYITQKRLNQTVYISLLLFNNRLCLLVISMLHVSHFFDSALHDELQSLRVRDKPGAGGGGAVCNEICSDSVGMTDLCSNREPSIQVIECTVCH